MQGVPDEAEEADFHALLTGEPCALMDLNLRF